MPPQPHPAVRWRLIVSSSDANARPRRLKAAATWQLNVAARMAFLEDLVMSSPRISEGVPQSWGGMYVDFSKFYNPIWTFLYSHKWTQIFLIKNKHVICPRSYNICKPREEKTTCAKESCLLVLDSTDLPSKETLAKMFGLKVGFGSTKVGACTSPWKYSKKNANAKLLSVHSTLMQSFRRRSPSFRNGSTRSIPLHRQYYFATSRVAETVMHVAGAKKHIKFSPQCINTLLSFDEIKIWAPSMLEIQGTCDIWSLYILVKTPSFSPTLHAFHVQYALVLFVQTFLLGAGSSPEHSTSRIVCWAVMIFSCINCDVISFLRAAYVGTPVLGYSQSKTVLPLIMVTSTEICSSPALTLTVRTGGGATSRISQWRFMLKQK